MSSRKNHFFIFFSADNINVKIDGFTISELAERLELSYRTVQKRLQRAGIEPITTGAIYPKSALETIRETPSPGRPPKKPTSNAPFGASDT
ncbi:MAG: hypothetical protein LBH43_21560 [Treponema sp.]|jgi:hypothetical protein|nr:hypothetical protein [Treponema sp.]